MSCCQALKIILSSLYIGYRKKLEKVLTAEVQSRLAGGADSITSASTPRSSKKEGAAQTSTPSIDTDAFRKLMLSSVPRRRPQPVDARSSLLKELEVAGTPNQVLGPSKIITSESPGLDALLGGTGDDGVDLAKYWQQSEQ